MGSGLIIALAIVAFIAATALIAAANIAAAKILSLVNAQLPLKDQFEPFLWYHSKTQRLFRQYRRIYPDGKLIRTHRLLAAAGFTCFALAVWLIYQTQP